MRPRSPLEHAIDRACGVSPAQRAAWDRERAQEAPYLESVGDEKVTMRCPTCGAEREAPLTKIDPPGTKVILFRCGMKRICFRSLRNPPMPVYLDADGQRIPFS